jgi:hypothetical protein
MTFQTQDSCESYWIMAQGQMKGIDLSFISFLESLAINYTTLELATYLEEALGTTKYHHQENGIPIKKIMSVLSDHGSKTNEKDPSIFHKLSGELANKLHYFRVGHLPRKGIRKHEVPSPGQWHYKLKIHVSPLESCLKDNE